MLKFRNVYYKMNVSGEIEQQSIDEFWKQLNSLKKDYEQTSKQLKDAKNTHEALSNELKILTKRKSYLENELQENIRL